MIIQFLIQAKALQISSAWGMQGQVQNGAIFNRNFLILVAISSWNYVASLLGSCSSALNFFFTCWHMLLWVTLKKNQKSAKVNTYNSSISSIIA